MQTLRTTILEHVTTAGSHYDWLFENPTDPSGLLWAARVAHPPRSWLDASPLILTPMLPHRRLYLTYQGPLTRNRGHVRCVDRGTIVPQIWQPGRQQLEIHTRFCHARVDLRPLGDASSQRLCASIESVV